MKKLIGLIYFVAASFCLCAQTNITFTRLVSFDGTNGALPYAGLTIGKDGNFYGTTCRGGDSNCGTIFRMTLDGRLTKLFSFNGNNGYWPDGELVQGRDENLYGMTTLGGNGYDSLHQQGAGTIFRIKCDGTCFTNLYLFDGMSQPIGGLTLGTDGEFYGGTRFGGTRSTGGDGFVFRFSSDGDFTNLLTYDFRKFSRALGGFVLGRDGNLYCTTSGGGEYDGGVFLRLTTNGTFTVLASFPLTNFFRASRNKLVHGTDGDFYGTTEYGGTNNNAHLDRSEYDFGDGTVFKVTTNGVVTTLVNFNGRNGAHPRGALVQGSDGGFYGVTTEFSHGSIFRVATNGSISTLYSFALPDLEYSMTNGALPCGLVMDSNGNFYGTTALGGEKAHMAGAASGTVFRFRLDFEHAVKK